MELFLELLGVILGVVCVYFKGRADQLKDDKQVLHERSEILRKEYLERVLNR